MYSYCISVSGCIDSDIHPASNDLPDAAKPFESHSERSLSSLQLVVAMCEMSVQHLRGTGKVCETIMQRLHGPFTVCEMTMQHLRGPFTVCETTMQHLHTLFTMCGVIMQHLHSLFVMCVPTTGTIIHPCEMSGGRMLLRPYMYPANFAAPAGAAPTTGTIIHPCGMSGGRMRYAPTRVQSSGPGYPANFAGVRRRPPPPPNY